jgi:hypothetical protein
MSGLAESLIVLGVILATALVGLLVNMVLPEHHRNDTTRSHFLATISVVATLTALVLGLAMTTANTTRSAMIQDVALLSSTIVRLDTMLRQYGPEAAAARANLVQYAVHKREDLFPQAAGAQVNLANPATTALFDALQQQLLDLTPRNEAQKWRRSQALELSNQIATVRWAITEQGNAALPQGVVLVVTFWLAILFGTYGLFTPRHATAIVALVLCVVAVAAAILLILEARTPFTGLVRIGSAALVEAVDSVSH